MKAVAQNRRARFDYEMVDTMEAGVILTGPEVKACRQGHISLMGSYVSFYGGKPMLKNAKISKYTYSADPDHKEMRDRELLLNKNESAKLQRALEEKGMSVVPLEVRAGKYIKVLLGLGRGRKKFDKRQKIKEREIGRRVREGREE
jgi:SsrA-binding protein